MRRIALLVGATGLVGGHLLTRLLASDAYERVVVLTRRSLERSHDTLHEQVIDFDLLEKVSLDVRVDDAYCCLGTTIKKAGSQAAFRRVDLEYPLQVAELAVRSGCSRFFLVSALGADADSRVFYNRVKGELEQRLAMLNFDALVILRPSLLLGARDELRVGERVASWVTRPLTPLMAGSLKRYRPIAAEAVAAAMYRAAVDSNAPAAAESGRPATPGSAHVRVLESDEIAELATRA